MINMKTVLDRKEIDECCFKQNNKPNSVFSEVIYRGQIKGGHVKGAQASLNGRKHWAANPAGECACATPLDALALLNHETGVTRGESIGSQSQALDLDTGEPLKTFKWEDYVP